MTEFKVSSWECLVQLSSGLVKDRDYGLWFRGHTRGHYSLVPSLLRYENGERSERHLFDLFNRLRPQDLPRVDDSWETLFHMQHYGVPTRLLDWTESLGVALYFATSDPAVDCPCVYALDHIKLNKLSPEIAGMAGDCLVLPNMDRDYQDKYLDKPLDHKSPIACFPRYHNQRSLRQSGMFTVHGSNLDSLDDQVSDGIIHKIVLEEGILPEIKDILDLTGLNSGTLYPDIVGVPAYIISAAKLKPIPLDGQKERSKIRACLQERLAQMGSYLERGPAGPSPEDSWDAWVEGVSGSEVGTSYLHRTDEEEVIHMWVTSDNSLPYLVVRGPAGMGKTNLLLWSILRDARLSSVPAVFVSLRFFEMGTLRKVVLGNMLPKGSSNREAQVAEEMIREGEVLLVIDGLDELARAKDEEAVADLIREVEQLVGSKKKAIFACRDHIYERLQKAGVFPPGKLKECELGKLDEGLVRERLEELTSERPVPPAVVEVARIPLFYKILRELYAGRVKPKWRSGALGMAEVYEAWLRSLLERAEDSENPYENRLRDIADIAGEMLNERTDCFELRSLAEDKEELVMALGTGGIFVEERKDVWGFSHASVGEFVLAWSVHDELSTRSFRVLTKTPDFDYLGAEAYQYIHSLYGGSFDEFLANALEALKQDDLDEPERNNLVRNVFEAIGELAPPGDARTEDITLAALEFVNPNDDGAYIRFRTRYNVVRCLERVHASSPRPYFQHSIDYYVAGKFKELQFGAYAARGFHRPAQEVGAYPRMVLMNGTLGGDPSIGKALIDCLESLTEPEMAEDAKLLRLNCTHSLIRWLDLEKHGESLVEDLEKHTWSAEEHLNIFCALYLRDALGEHSKLLTNLLPIEDLAELERVFPDPEMREAFQAL